MLAKRAKCCKAAHGAKLIRADPQTSIKCQYRKPAISFDYFASASKPGQPRTFAHGDVLDVESTVSEGIEKGLCALGYRPTRATNPIGRRRRFGWTESPEYCEVGWPLKKMASPSALRNSKCQRY